MIDFVNHHVHSHFSTLDGLGKPEGIIARAIDLGQRSISVTDHGTLSGLVQMQRAAKQAGIGFTPGCEVYFTQDRTLRHKDRLGEKYYHLILLAHTETGYKNLVKLQTMGWEDGFYHKPRIDYEALHQHHEGMTVTTACLGSLVNKYLSRGDMESAMTATGTLVDIFGSENVFVELQRHGIPDQEKILGMQAELAKKMGLELLATTDAHYCDPGDSDVHDSLLCTSTQATKKQENRFRFDSDKFFLHSGEQMIDLFPPEDFPRAVSNTVSVAERTDFHLKLDDEKTYLMPSVRVDPGKTESETFRDHVLIGARDTSRYGDDNGNIPDHVQERIDYEIDVINNMGFGGYFLMVEHIVNLMARHGIKTGPGRGCLAPWTTVWTPDGLRRIEDISIGDQVYSRAGLDVVTAIPVHESADGEQMVSIFTNQGENLVTTYKHKVLIDTAQGPQWKKSEEILVGDVLVCDTGDITLSGNSPRHQVVTSLDRIAAPDKIYDLTVKADPSFATSAGTVHNSAPGSVVVYCLGITTLDPFAHDLYFERFLNPDRISMPDIDIDIPRERRHEALSLIEDEYGKGHVAHMSNYNMMGMRDALRRTAKVFDCSPGESESLCNAVAGWCESHGEKLSEFADRGIIPDLVKEEMPKTDKTWEILTTAARLEGTMFANGVHACGIVITDDPVDEHFPIRHSKNTSIPICQFDGPDTESLGGVKMDILGLINLDQCEEAERNALLDLGVEVDSSTLPLDDPQVYEMLSEGRGGGVFQLGCLAGDTMIDGMRLDALYAARGSRVFPSSLRSVYMGEGVVGPNPIRDVVYSGVKDTLRITTASDHEITATADHRMFTRRGWVPAGEITIDDEVLVVRDEGYTYPTDPVRGRQGVLDLFSRTHPDHVLIDNPHPLTINGATFYPTFRHTDLSHQLVLIYPEDGHRAAMRSLEAVRRYDDLDLDLEILSYSQVVERAYERDPLLSYRTPEPTGTRWVPVTDIVPAGKIDTYDIMMLEPVDNFVANGFMVHNSSGIRSLSRRMKPSEFADLSALIALYRPGPMGSGIHDAYCDRKNYGATMDVNHPDMADLLSKTYNLTVYQEDLMTMARHFAGYTGAEADDLRKAVAKKIPAKMQAQKEKFIPAVNSRFEGNLGQQLWDIIEPFGAYAFCKAHSSAYAATVYRTAWLKAHYPAQFAGAVIDHTIGKKDDLVTTMAWIRAEGVTVLPPDITRSLDRSVTGRNEVVLPLHIIRGLGENRAGGIIAERNDKPFTSVIDVVARCSLSQSLVINMSKAGAFDSLGANRAEVISRAMEIVSIARTVATRSQFDQGLFGEVVGPEDDSTLIDLSVEPRQVKTDDGEVMDVDADLYSQWERESLGVLLGDHPFSAIRELRSAQPLLESYPPVDDIDCPMENARFSGIITGIVNKVSKKGNDFCMFTLESDISSVPAITFSRLDESLENTMVVAEGKVDNDGFGDEDFSPKVVCFGLKKVRMDALKNKG